MPWPPLAVLPLSLANVRFLLQVALLQPTLDLPAALALLAYQHQRQVAAIALIASASSRTSTSSLDLASPVKASLSCEH